MAPPDSPLEKDRTTAFGLLRDLVADDFKHGRRSYGARLKPRLLDQTAYGFSEEKLDYGSFLQFLDAAREREFISLHPAPKGPDRIAAPVGEEPPAPTSLPTSSSGHRIRRDLWDAFVDWSNDETRCFDRDAGEAIHVPKDVKPLEPSEVSDRRRAIATDPHRYVRIEPVSFDTQVGWMRDFAAQSDTDVKTHLEAALQAEKPARAFAGALTDHRLVRSRWNRFRQERIEQVIRTWMSTNGLDIALTPREQPRPDTPEASTPRETPEAGSRVERLRGALHNALDEMTESELSQVWVPAGHLIK